MSISKDKKTSVIKQYQNGSKDTGSSEVQVAVLTERINNLTSHMKENRKDNSAEYGLLKLVSRRKKLLSYLKRTSEDKYKDLIAKLGLRK